GCGEGRVGRQWRKGVEKRSRPTGPRRLGVRWRPLRRNPPGGETRGGTPIEGLPPPIPPPERGGGSGGGQRPWPKPRQKSLASVGVSPPIFFVRSCPFVIAGLDPAIHAAASLAQRSHRRFERVASA